MHATWMVMQKGARGYQAIPDGDRLSEELVQVGIWHTGRSGVLFSALSSC